MTDNEIIKALECCIKSENCAKCSYSKECDGLTVHKNSIDLINRQRDEIKRLQTALFKQEDTMQILGEEKQKYFDELQTAKAEIERLTVNMNAFGLGMKREKERADNSKAEVVKEFAEIVKDRAYNILRMYCSMDVICKFDACIDNIVKEKTEDTGV